VAASSAGHDPVLPQAPPPPLPLGPWTRLHQGILQPKQYTDGTIWYAMFPSTGEPSNLSDALAGAHWRKAMEEEYMLSLKIKPGTWFLPTPPKL
jgi:hypothetical protein